MGIVQKTQYIFLLIFNVLNVKNTIFGLKLFFILIFQQYIELIQNITTLYYTEYIEHNIWLFLRVKTNDNCTIIISYYFLVFIVVYSLKIG